MMSVGIALILFVVVLLSTNKRYRWIYIIIKTLPRDIRGLILMIKGFIFLRKCIKHNYTVPGLFSSVVKKNPQKIAFYFEDEKWTYQQVDEFSNKIARYFSKNGYEKGDTVAVLLENCIEYPCIWLGLLKIGVKAALINTNLVKDSLLHSITVTKCKSMIYGSNLSQSVTDILSNLETLKLYQIHEKENDRGILQGAVDLRKELDGVSSQPVRNLELKYDDPAIYIFTSGTTGLPKAAVITHLRCVLMGKSTELMGLVAPNEIFYTPLPLYHTAGGLLGVGQSLLSGMTVVLRKKFSATHYFKDCVKYNATIAQYIGELCRYILATPDTGPIDHRIKTIVGNGLRPQIWKPFVQRFGIKNVYEVYGSTEGISGLANIDNTEGSVGFLPRYFNFLYPVALIKCNEATGEPIRNSKGRCVQCGVEEHGILVGKINPDTAVFKFDGYTDPQSSEKKILYDVFRKGDRYFNSGDILVYDELGYYYFKDRTGDTFRWKGENVSTAEVEAIISNVVKLNDVAVYGVKIPNTDGNAGMAAIVDTDQTLNMESISAAFKENLPTYAIPIFIRVLKSVPLTGTYKLKKTELREDGYNLDKVKDTIYFLDLKQKKYVTLTNEHYEDIVSGKIRL